MEKYLCSHCGHRFESASAENLICPNCFWSSSLKKEGEKSAPEAPRQKLSPPAHFSPWRWLGVGLGILLLGGIFLFASRHLQKQNEIIQKIQVKNAKVIASEAPELALLPEEREILSRNVPVEGDVELTDSEKEILGRRIPMKSRLIQGLAAPPWDEKQFNEFLKAQETQYRMPFEWSYRRKLMQLFRQHYVVAAQGFEAKDYLKARDEWIRSLAFPIYQNDPKKHQGVVLTMLRPSINDTLAKIGTMNAFLTQKSGYEKEEKIRSDYDSLYELLQKSSWDEASAKLLELRKELSEIQRSPEAENIPLPPLPQEVSLIDPDIREVLLAQTAPAASAVQDWTSLDQDLTAKEQILKNRLPGTLEMIQKQYQEALDLIRDGNWKEAKELLQKIDFPPALREDAQAKIKILDKSVAPAAVPLDSEKKTS